MKLRGGAPDVRGRTSTGRRFLSERPGKADARPLRARRVDTTNKMVKYGLLLLGVAALAAPFAAADTTSSTSSSSQSSVSQSVSIPQENVLAALALGGGGFLTLNQIADINRQASVSSTFDRSLSLDENDVLLALALRNNGAFGGSFLGNGFFGTSFNSVPLGTNFCATATCTNGNCTITGVNNGFSCGISSLSTFNSFNDPFFNQRFIGTRNLFCSPFFGC